jgi:hypothetical protein
MPRMMIVLSVLLVGILGFAAPAVAVTPDRSSFSFSETGTDPAGTTCSFAVDFSQTEYGFFETFVDQNGDFVKAIVHINYDATISANGHTLVEQDMLTRTIYADGTMRDTGLTVHIQGPGGVVMRDAGLIAYSDTSETLAYVRGPHPQLLGASFCAALGGQ